MGNWRIVIEGLGPHHNGGIYREGDVDKKLEDFVQDLRFSGQKIEFAKFEVISGQVEYK